jgi:cell division protein FtsI (penicillin-binding protein 3)
MARANDSLMVLRITQAQPKKTNRSRASNRDLLLGGVLVLWMLGLGAQLYHLQIIDYGEFLARAQRQQQHMIEVAPRRGEIYDRQMNPLAMSLSVDSVFADPNEISDPNMVADLLAPALSLDARELRGRLTNSRSFCWVKRKVTAEEANRVRDLKLKGIYFQQESKRFYPKGDLAAQIVGYVGLDDKGLAGLEYGMDKAIRGRPGRVLLATDARRKSFQSTEWPGEPGKSIVLTLDEKIQYIAEKALAEGVEKWKAAGGVAIVQNPNTGEILAMASQPTFDPSDFATSSPQALHNRGVAWVYEPGSTFKLVTMSAVLEENLAKPNEIIDCQMGSIVLAGHVIHDHKRLGALTVEDVLVHSSNVGAIKLGLRLGEQRLYKYVRSFGFGEKTNIELPGEERGLLKPPSHWSGLSIGEISIGQEVGVTALQLITAYSAVANGGVLFEPRLIRDLYRGQEHDPMAPVPGHRVISERTANIMKQFLAAVVARGTGKAAQLTGYTAAGKTGTAQKIDPSRAYSHSHYAASFVGFVPVERPAITILVAIDTPVGAIYGADVAAPVFKSIAEQTLGYANVPQDIPAQRPQLIASTPPSVPTQKLGDFAGNHPKDSEHSQAATSPVRPASFSSQEPGPISTDRGGEATGAAPTVVLDNGPRVNVPDFSGLAARNIAQECQKLGLELSLLGSGLAVEQSLPAHAQVAPGTRLVVKLSRFSQ